MIVTAKDKNFAIENTAQDFDSIFSEHWSQIYDVVFRMISDKGEAEDLALETFWQLYRNPPQNRENLDGWLYRVAVNLGLNALRARKRRARYEEEAGSVAIGSYQGAMPENEFELAERRREVQAVLVRIKPRSAKILVLRYSGLSYKEIAAALKLKQSSVGKLLARAEAEFEKAYRQLIGG